jgi:hypothetical protein
VLEGGAREVLGLGDATLEALLEGGIDVGSLRDSKRPSSAKSSMSRTSRRSNSVKM